MAEKPIRDALIQALDAYLRQDETAGDTDNNVYRRGQAAMSQALSAPPPAGAQQAVADALNAYGDLCFARGAGEWPNDPNRAVPDHKDHDRAFAAVLALAAPAAAQATVSAEDQWIEQTRHLNCPVCNGSGHVEDVLPQGDAAQRALLELLLLKDMKDKWEAEELSGFAYKSTDNHRLHNEQRANYQRRKPLAWEAARKAVAATPAPEAAPIAALMQISDLLSSMFSGARSHVRGEDEEIVGYTVRNGALHKIVGILASYKPVIIPANLPKAHETITGLLCGTSEAAPSAKEGEAEALKCIGYTSDFDLGYPLAYPNIGAQNSTRSVPVYVKTADYEGALKGLTPAGVDDRG